MENKPWPAKTPGAVILTLQLWPGLSRPASPSSPSGTSSDPGNPAPASPTVVGPAEIMVFKDELLSSLWADFAAVFKDEVRAVLESEMSAIRIEIQAAKTELANFKVAIKNEVAVMGNTMEEMGTFWMFRWCRDSTTHSATTFNPGSCPRGQMWGLGSKIQTQ